MKISETHKNGATIHVSGWFGVDKIVTDWRDRQDASPEKPVESERKIGFQRNDS